MVNVKKLQLQQSNKSHCKSMMDAYFKYKTNFDFKYYIMFCVNSTCLTMNYI